MYVDHADSLSHQAMCLNESKNLVIRGSLACRQICQEPQRACPRFQIAARQLPQYKGVHQYVALIQGCFELWQAFPQMINPNRRVNENHRAFERRLDVGSNWG